MPYLHMLGFEVMGYGCSTCMENSCVEPLIPPDSLVCCGVLSGNRNFEGRILPEIKANYLASPPLVVAFAMAGRIDIDFNQEPLGKKGILLNPLKRLKRLSVSKAAAN